MKRITRQNMAKLEIKLLPWHWTLTNGYVCIYTGKVHSHYSRLVQQVEGPKPTEMAADLVLKHNEQL